MRKGCSSTGQSCGYRKQKEHVGRTSLDQVGIWGIDLFSEVWKWGEVEFLVGRILQLSKMELRGNEEESELAVSSTWNVVQHVVMWTGHLDLLVCRAALTTTKITNQRKDVVFLGRTHVGQGSGLELTSSVLSKAQFMWLKKTLLCSHPLMSWPAFQKLLIQPLLLFSVVD